MPANEYPVLLFETPFDERSQFEASSKGYLSGVSVQQQNGNTYPVVFYDCVRLEQDLEYEVSSGRMCVADPGMIVVPEVTLENMLIAIKKLDIEGYFNSLQPVPRL